MFDFVRKHTKVMMFVMFLLIIPSFVLFGIDGYNRYREGGIAVAQVDGHDITQSELDFAHKAESDRLRASMPNIDAKLLDSPEARQSTLDRLIRERVFNVAADKLHLITSDARLARELQENSTIASLRGPDGKLDMERYRQLAANQGMTPAGLEARVRHDLSVRQVEAGIIGSGFAPNAISAISLNAFFEKRDVQIVNFLTADFLNKITPTEAELEAYYKSNLALFQSPEQANIEYVVLDMDSVKKNISIAEADLRGYYDQNVARLSGNEERRASHILINAAKDAPKVDREKAKSRALELLQLIRKTPDSFSELAKKNSQDTGSAVNGGDLDFFARGAMVKPFEDAAFAMKKGEVSEVVESEFGFHIIKLTDVKIPKQKSFDELRAGIDSDLKTQQAQRKFAETAEIFTNAVYEQSDSLKPIAEKLKLEVKTANGLSRIPSVGVPGVLSSTKFLNAIFSPDSIEKKRNTEAIETAPSQLVAGRITQYSSAHALPFAEVGAIVRERVIAASAAEMAKKEGSSKLVAWKTAPSTAVMPNAVIVSRDQSQNVNQLVLSAILRANVTALPVFIGIDLGAQGYSVVRINKLLPRVAPVEATAQQERIQFAQWWTAAENDAYYGLLKEKFKATVAVKK